MGVLSADTSRDAERVQYLILAKMSPQKKAVILRGAVQAGFAVKAARGESMSIPDPFEIAGQVVDVLNELQIPYFLGGSIASTLHSEPRFTQDVDIVVRLARVHLEPLRCKLEEHFHLSQVALEEAISRRSCANLVHFDTGFKVDLMVSRERDFEESRFERRTRISIGEREFWVATAEDMVLVKLEWFRMGGQVSDHQWRDVLSLLLAVPQMDLEYLSRWAVRLGISDLLETALKTVQ